jgi:hypothetical protein
MPGFTAHGGSSQMMIVNGTTDGTLPNKVVWGQDVTGLTCVQVPKTTVKTYPLYGGQHWQAGEVQVKFEAGKIYVKMVISGERDGDDGWLITGMKVHIALTCDLIPQKNGNPIPGKFMFKLPFTPGVLDTGWQEIPYTGTSFPVCIAAHATLVHAEVGHMEQYEYCDKRDRHSAGRWWNCGSFTRLCVQPRMDMARFRQCLHLRTQLDLGCRDDDGCRCGYRCQSRLQE